MNPTTTLTTTDRPGRHDNGIFHNVHVAGITVASFRNPEAARRHLMEWKVEVARVKEQGPVAVAALLADLEIAG